MNNYYFKKDRVDKIVELIKKELLENKSTIQKAFELDYKEWEYELNFEKFIDIIDSMKNKEYLPKFSKEEIIDGIGKIALLCNQNPYLIFNFILSALYTNNKVEVVLENKMIATNKVITELVRKVLSLQKIDDDTVTYVEVVNKEEIISSQENYDMIYYFGNKSSYLNFTKRIHVDSKFEEFGEINLYSDSTQFKEQIVEIDKWAYLNEIKVNIFNKDINEAIERINKLNSINKMTIIFSKDLDKVTKFVKEVKSEFIFVNINSTNNYRYETNLNNLVYKKIIKW